MAITQRYDALFLKALHEWKGEIPLPFLRAVAYRESLMNPKAASKTSSARGLMQITAPLLRRFKKATKIKYSPSDMLKAWPNIRVGVWHMVEIVNSFKKNHPDSLSPIWCSLNYVGLLAQAYTAGFNETRGVGYVVGHMEKSGVKQTSITPVIVAQVATRLKERGHIKGRVFMSEPDRLDYVRRVQLAYSKEPEYTKCSSSKSIATYDKPEYSEGGASLYGQWLVYSGIGMFALIVAAKKKKKGGR